MLKLTDANLNSDWMSKAVVHSSLNTLVHSAGVPGSGELYRDVKEEEEEESELAFITRSTTSNTAHLRAPAISHGDTVLTAVL